MEDGRTKIEHVDSRGGSCSRIESQSIQWRDILIWCLNISLFYLRWCSRAYLLIPGPSRLSASLNTTAINIGLVYNIPLELLKGAVEYPWITKEKGHQKYNEDITGEV